MDMKPLPNAFTDNEDHWSEGDDVATPAKPLVEREMTRLSAALRLKPSWYTKFRDQDILAKWRAEALKQAEHMKESHIDYVLSELDGYANLRDEATGAEVACYDRIWQSDKLVPAALKARLIARIAKLEKVPDSEKGWHPRSNDMVLDLVHPSLYPIVYGRTLAYPEETTDHDGTKLEIIPSPLPSDFNPVGNQPTSEHSDGDNDNDDEDDDYVPKPEDYCVSQKFQWLPTDFVVSDDGKSVKSTSYINNLHPDQHAELHAAIEDLIGAYIPLFERVLTDSIPSNKAVPARVNNSYSYNLEGYKPEPNWQEVLKGGKRGRGEDGEENEEENGEEDGEEDEEEDEVGSEYGRLYDEWASGRSINLPEVPPEGYVLGSLEKRSTWYSLAGKTIQVIVKLANIHLTPEKPEYAGGSWHIEGMANEAIAASGIYYYSEENTTESRLAFRTAASIPGNYEQHDKRGCRLTWGVSRDDPCVNELGAVVTCQDRAIAFPNIYQHKVSPFELKDKSKPGHRKIVALFLVDPAIRRPSTTRVPPQQQEWRSAALLSNKTLRRALAPEIMDWVNSLAGGTMALKEAKSYRLELMDERKAFVAHNDQRFFEVAFDLCEH
ncbi:hypothetical protein FRC12_019702 [Ceratobasidium sp. 428]|nr:hypothetical protein FRC12_019702 [Ceratobasidium sp. 428]